MRYPGFVIFIMNILAHGWNAVFDVTVMQKYALAYLLWIDIDGPSIYA